MFKDKPDGRTYHDPVAESRARLEDTIREMLPKEKYSVCSAHQVTVQNCSICGSTFGFNQALSEVHALVPAIIEKVYEQVYEEVRILVMGSIPYGFCSTHKHCYEEDCAKCDYAAVNIADLLSLLSTKNN